MMVMTAKVDLKKVLLALAAVAAGVLALVLILGGKDAQATAAVTAAGNDSRVAFLEALGWEVSASPVESGQVRIPETTTEVFDRYNDLQLSQGYDLKNYAGKTAMRYVYKINNFPGATEPVYATLLVYKNEIIGGDITDTAASGKIQGLKKPKAATSPSEATATAPAA